jgi:L-ascorbate metabolism protein UlaG (beta-lactamase superfamily)
MKKICGNLPPTRRPNTMPGRLCLGIAALASLTWLLASPAAAETNLKGDRIPAVGGDWILRPVNHATVMLQWKDQILCVDPVGGAQRFAALPAPTLILVTDIHGDHLSAETLAALGGGRIPIIAPAAVREQLGGDLRARTEVLAQGAKITRHDLTIEAVPAYNLAADRLQYHPKGRANGYLLTAGGKRIYLSADTEDTPEMRALKNIDVAFLCMNLPYTMTVEQAASAVQAFRPKIVYPYHSRGSNLEKFKALVGTESGVEVRLRDWYGPAPAAK